MLQKISFVKREKEYGYGIASNEPEQGVDSPEGRHAPLRIDAIRRSEFPLLRAPLLESSERSGSEQIGRRSRDGSRKGLVYLDHAGATLYGASQLRDAMSSLLTHVHGNPHSQGPVSSVTAARTDAARLAVLQFFGAHPREYAVIFTSGATAALKLVGECFSWQPPLAECAAAAAASDEEVAKGATLDQAAAFGDAGAADGLLGSGSVFAHARNSHNSVLGIREYASAAGAAVASVDLDRLERGSFDGDGRKNSENFEAICWGGCGDGESGEENEADSMSGGGAEEDPWKLADAATDSGSKTRRGSDSCASCGAAATAKERDVVDCLFAFPAECNATGVRGDLSLIARVKRGGLAALAAGIVSLPVGLPISSSGPVAMATTTTAAAVAAGNAGSSPSEAEPDASAGESMAAASQRRDLPPRDMCATCWRLRNGEEDGRQRQRRRRRRRQRWWVLLDAAKYVATAPLDLSKYEADFVVASFYKIFGYPTGLGVLLVRHRAARRLRKRYFGGGTVVAALADVPFHRLRTEPDRGLVDGTENFLGILALEAGFAMLAAVGGMEAVSAHVSCLARLLHDRLVGLQHFNGGPVCRIYGAWSEAHTAGMAGGGGGDSKSSSRQGPVVMFSVLRPDGALVGHGEVEKLAELHCLQLRTGCFCNPGACQAALDLSDADVLRNLQAGHVCWDDNDMVDGRPTGAVRASLGWMSNWEDVDALVRFIDKQFCARTPLAAGPAVAAAAASAELAARGGVAAAALADSTAIAAATVAAAVGGEVAAADVFAPSTWSPPPPPPPPQLQPTLEAIYVYPIKSCAAQRAQGQWPVGRVGLLHDREWAIADHTGRALRLKEAPMMCHIRPRVDLDAGIMTVTAPGMDDLLIPLNWGGEGVSDGSGGGDKRACTVRVCGVRCRGVLYGASASQWFSKYLGLPCSLVRAVAAKADAAAAAPSDGAAAAAVTSTAYATAAAPVVAKAAAVEGPELDRAVADVAAPAYTSLFGGLVGRLWGSATPGDSVADCAAVGGGATANGGGGGRSNKETGRAFSNEAQYLLISRASVDRVNGIIHRECIEDGESHQQVTAEHFRPNFVVSGTTAHEEDLWRGVRLGLVDFFVTGPCSRCAMINIDPTSGDTGGVALRVLASYRRERANILFGQFLALAASSDTLAAAVVFSTAEAGATAAAAAAATAGDSDDAFDAIVNGDRSGASNAGDRGGPSVGCVAACLDGAHGEGGVRWLWEGMAVEPRLAKETRNS